MNFREVWWCGMEGTLLQLLASTNSPWGYVREGLLSIGRIFASEIWGAYFREGLFLYIYFLFSCGFLACFIAGCAFVVSNHAHRAIT